MYVQVVSYVSILYVQVGCHSQKIMCDWLNMWLACDISHTGILCITQSLSGDESESTSCKPVWLLPPFKH